MNLANCCSLVTVLQPKRITGITGKISATGVLFITIPFFNFLQETLLLARKNPDGNKRQDLCLH
jgi:hypothetical protein